MEDRKSLDLTKFGIKGGEFLRKTLSSSVDPILAIQEFQQENGVQIPSLQNALPFLDLHDSPRYDFYHCLLFELKNLLISKIKELIVEMYTAPAPLNIQTHSLTTKPSKSILNPNNSNEGAKNNFDKSGLVNKNALSILHVKSGPKFKNKLILLPGGKLKTVRVRCTIPVTKKKSDNGKINVESSTNTGLNVHSEGFQASNVNLNGHKDSISNINENVETKNKILNFVKDPPKKRILKDYNHQSVDDKYKTSPTKKRDQLIIPKTEFTSPCHNLSNISQDVGSHSKKHSFGNSLTKNANASSNNIFSDMLLITNPNQVNKHNDALGTLQLLLEKSFPALADSPGLGTIPMFIMENLPDLPRRYVKKLIKVPQPIEESDPNNLNKNSKKIKLKISKTTSSKTNSKFEVIPSGPITDKNNNNTDQNDLKSKGSGETAQALYQICSLPVKRHVWHEYYELFRRELKPYLKAYCENRKLSYNYPVTRYFSNLVDMAKADDLTEQFKLILPTETSVFCHDLKDLKLPHVGEKPNKTESSTNVNRPWFLYYALPSKERRTKDASFIAVANLLSGGPGGGYAQISLSPGGPENVNQSPQHHYVRLYNSLAKYLVESFCAATSAGSKHANNRLLYATLQTEYFAHLRDTNAKISLTPLSKEDYHRDLFSSQRNTTNQRNLEKFRKFFYLFEILLKDRIDLLQRASNQSTINHLPPGKTFPAPKYDTTSSKSSVETTLKPKSAQSTSSYYAMYCLNSFTPLNAPNHFAKPNKPTPTKTDRIAIDIAKNELAPQNSNLTTTSGLTTTGIIKATSNSSVNPSANINAFNLDALTNPLESWSVKAPELWNLFASLACKVQRVKGSSFASDKSTKLTDSKADVKIPLPKTHNLDDTGVSEPDTGLKIKLKLLKSRRKKGALAKNKKSVSTPAATHVNGDHVLSDTNKNDDDEEYNPTPRFRIARTSKPTARKLESVQAALQENIDKNDKKKLSAKHTPQTDHLNIDEEKSTAHNSNKKEAPPNIVTIYKYDPILFEQFGLMLSDPFTIDFLSSICANMINQMTNSQILPRENPVFLITLSFLNLSLHAQRLIQLARDWEHSNNSNTVQNPCKPSKKHKLNIPPGNTYYHTFTTSADIHMALETSAHTKRNMYPSVPFIESGLITEFIPALIEFTALGERMQNLNVKLKNIPNTPITDDYFDTTFDPTNLKPSSPEYIIAHYVNNLEDPASQHLTLYHILYTFSTFTQRLTNHNSKANSSTFTSPIHRNTAHLSLLLTQLRLFCTNNRVFALAQIILHVSGNGPNRDDLKQQPPSVPSTKNSKKTKKSKINGPVKGSTSKNLASSYVDIQGFLSKPYSTIVPNISVHRPEVDLFFHTFIILMTECVRAILTIISNIKISQSHASSNANTSSSTTLKAQAVPSSSVKSSGAFHLTANEKTQTLQNMHDELEITAHKLVLKIVDSFFIASNLTSQETILIDLYRFYSNTFVAYGMELSESGKYLAHAFKPNNTLHSPALQQVYKTLIENNIFRITKSYGNSAQLD